MLWQNTKYFFLPVFHMLPFHNFGFPLWMPWLSQKLHKAGLWNFPLKKLSSHFLKNATDSLSKVNTVCQQYMVVLSLKSYLGLHCKQMPHRVSGQGTGNLAWKEKTNWVENKRTLTVNQARIDCLQLLKLMIICLNRTEAGRIIRWLLSRCKLHCFFSLLI